MEFCMLSDIVGNFSAIISNYDRNKFGMEKDGSGTRRVRDDSKSLSRALRKVKPYGVGKLDRCRIESIEKKRRERERDG